MPAVTSRTQLMNIALIEIGEQPIVTADVPENTEQWRQVTTRYDDVRDAVLREGTWNCATTRAVLSLLAATPAFEYDFAYQLPVDFIRLINVDNQLVRFRIEHMSGSRVFLSSESDGNIRYVFRLEDVSVMDESLKQAIGFRLAAAICLRLTGDKAKKKDMLTMYTEALAAGLFHDAKEAPIERLEALRWVNARYRGHHQQLVPRKIIV